MVIDLFGLLFSSVVLGNGNIYIDLPRERYVHLVETYPIEEPLFVQGLEIEDEERLLLSTGLYEDSRIGYLDVESGVFTEVDRLDDDYFGEGVTVTPEGVFQLTWKEETMFVRDIEGLDVVDTVSYDGEGWGLAYDADLDGVWMSNGSDTVVLRDLETFEIVDEIETEYDNLNELEYVDGYLFANVWLSYDVIRIDVESKEVDSIYNLREIVEELDLDIDERRQMDTLNGIAHIEGDEFYLSGKNYPYLFRVVLK